MLETREPRLLDETERRQTMKKKLTLTVLLLLLTGCAAEAVEPAPPSPTNELQGKPLDTTTTVDLSFLNTTTTQPPTQTEAMQTTQVYTPAPVTYGEPTAQQWDALAYCESGNRADYPPVSGGFSGLLMFHTGTWLANGGGEYAADAWLATRDQQIEIALRLWRSRGWQPWPGCSAKLGFN